MLLRKWVKAESGCAMMFGGSPAMGPSLAGMLAAQMEEVQPELPCGWWRWLWVGLADGFSSERGAWQIPGGDGGVVWLIGWAKGRWWAEEWIRS